jgi:hypothetical protein
MALFQSQLENQAVRMKNKMQNLYKKRVLELKIFNKFLYLEKEFMVEYHWPNTNNLIY